MTPTDHIAEIETALRMLQGLGYPASAMDALASLSALKQEIAKEQPQLATNISCGEPSRDRLMEAVRDLSRYMDVFSPTPKALKKHAATIAACRAATGDEWYPKKGTHRND